MICYLLYQAERGINAIPQHLHFSKVGISINQSEAGYAHNSREKLAILYFIINYELSKPIVINPIIRDELIQITRISELVDWISNLQQEKDVMRILEGKFIPKPEVRHQVFYPSVPEEELISVKELAQKLGISEKTINRNPQQFPIHKMGCQNYYYFSECKPGYSKK